MSLLWFFGVCIVIFYGEGIVCEVCGSLVFLLCMGGVLFILFARNLLVLVACLR